MKDNNEKVYLEYCFLLPQGVWNSIFDFESDLAKFLEAKGLEATILNNVRGSQSYKRILNLNKKPVIPVPVEPTTTQTPAQKLKEISGASPNIKPQGVVKTNIIKPKQRFTAPQIRFLRGRKMVRKDYVQRKAA